jgi:hypothetical protein
MYKNISRYRVLWMYKNISRYTVLWMYKNISRYTVLWMYKNISRYTVLWMLNTYTKFRANRLTGSQIGMWARCTCTVYTRHAKIVRLSVLKAGYKNKNTENYVRPHCNVQRLYTVWGSSVGCCTPQLTSAVLALRPKNNYGHSSWFLT